jgi:mannose-1-phosphate guanylyltransferase
MKGMILAAGLGTRLEPLSLIRPKPLFPVLNRPLLAIAIEQLQGMGATHVVINVHHLAAQVEKFVREGTWGEGVTVKVETEILGTGGGIKNCADELRDAPFCIVINGDIYHTFDLVPAMRYHTEMNNLVTLILCDDPRFNQVGIDADGKIVTVRERKVPGSQLPVGVLTFTGIHIISPRLFEVMPHAGSFDIMTCYLDLAARGEAVRGYPMHTGYWQDMGRIEAYQALHRELLHGKGSIIHPEAHLKAGVKMEGFVCVGKGSRIKQGASLKDTVVWDDVVVEQGSHIEGCIVADGARVRGEHRGEALVPAGVKNAA